MSNATPEKLVRSLIPGMIAKNEGRAVLARFAPPAEMPGLLVDKLREEAGELLAALQGGARERVLEELADLHEVFAELTRQAGENAANVEERAVRKRMQRGGFSAGLVVSLVELEPRLPPLKLVDGRIPCPKCGGRDTSITEEHGTVREFPPNEG